MDTSMKIPGADVAAMQSARPRMETAQDFRPEASPAAAPQQPAESVQVTISPAARQAEQAASQPQMAAPPPAAGTPPPSAAQAPQAVQAPAAAPRAEASVSATATPPAQAGEAAARATGAPETQPAGGAPQARQPDSPTASSSPAMQMYLDNASRPASQPEPAAVRVSA